MDWKKTVVIGASDNPTRYSYLAVERLQAKGHPVVAVGKRGGMIGSTPIQTDYPALTNVDTVTLYINPQLQDQFKAYIVSLHPRRVIFNPGTENPPMQQWVMDQGIIVQEACTLVLLSTGAY